MKEIFDFIVKNPLIRNVGIILILYFALFANTEKSGSLGNRITKETLHKNFNQAQEKGKFIIQNVKAAQEYSKKPSIPLKISYDDKKIGDGKDILECKDKAEFFVSIFTKDGRQLTADLTNQLSIGEKSNVLIEKNIIGMKQGGIRVIKVPFGITVEDNKIMEFLENYKTDLEYHITLNSIVKSIEIT